MTSLVHASHEHNWYSSSGFRREGHELPAIFEYSLLIAEFNRNFKWYLLPMIAMNMLGVHVWSKLFVVAGICSFSLLARWFCAVTVLLCVFLSSWCYLGHWDNIIITIMTGVIPLPSVVAQVPVFEEKLIVLSAYWSACAVAGPSPWVQSASPLSPRPAVLPKQPALPLLAGKPQNKWQNNTHSIE